MDLHWFRILLRDGRESKVLIEVLADLKTCFVQVNIWTSSEPACHPVIGFGDNHHHSTCLCLWLELELEEVFGFHVQPVLSLSSKIVSHIFGHIFAEDGDVERGG